MRGGLALQESERQTLPPLWLFLERHPFSDGQGLPGLPVQFRDAPRYECSGAYVPGGIQGEGSSLYVQHLIKGMRESDYW